jgi:hypothetical protein
MSPRNLLYQYYKECSILGKSYGMMERYHSRIHKYLSYPTIPLSSLVGIISVLPQEYEYYFNYFIPTLSFTIAVLNGFNTAINPKGKQYECNHIKNEFNNISSNINQYLNENNKTDEEYKIYSSKVLELIDVWKSLAPSCKRAYIESAKKKFIKLPVSVELPITPISVELPITPISVELPITPVSVELPITSVNIYLS